MDEKPHCIGNPGRVEQGLSQAEAVLTLKRVGHNELPSAKARTLVAIAVGVLREPMFLLLAACSAIYMALGDTEEALMLAGAVLVVLAITFVQERKTERTLEALRDLSCPRALVVRDGEKVRIPGRDVVPGDILVLSEGDRVPADCVLLECRTVYADESLLTGEATAVRKTQGSAFQQMERPGGDDRPFLYSGTLVVRGSGIAEVKATGLNTEIGRIGRSLETVQSEDTLLQRSTKRLVRNFAAIGLSLCLIVVIVYGLARGSWLNGLLAGITMAISMVPEEFPVVLTIFLALGAWRIAQTNVLTRRVPAIETLGAATVLCVDKTGTLTQNRMAVSKLSVGGVEVDANTDELTAEFAELVTFGVLASQPDPFDPMERAIHHLGVQVTADATVSREDWVLLRQYALSPQLPAMSHVWQPSEGQYRIVAAKGAPEAIAKLCRFDESRTANLLKGVTDLAAQGLRVLAVAKQIHEDEALPELQQEFPFVLVGLIGLSDPVRPMVGSSVKECYTAGIRVIMITGDYPETARHIARQIGLHESDQVITGGELAEMDDDELNRGIGSVDIFARVLPEQKLRIVNALKARGEVVAMTGDGVNDAPALKSAHIGIAMGQRGTDVAREAAALVLLDDDFSSIVRAIRLGRRIFTNITDAMAYIMAVHVPIAGLSLLPVLFGWPLILLPVHIVFLELIIDPACSIVFEAEPEDPDVMQKPPRDPNKPIISWKSLGLGLAQGASVLFILIAVYAAGLYLGEGEFEARALTYTTLLIANLGLILTNLSWSRTVIATLRQGNRALWWILGAVSAACVVILSVPQMREVFRFSTLHPADIAICLAAGILSVAWFEIVKLVRLRSQISVPSKLQRAR